MKKRVVTILQNNRLLNKSLLRRVMEVMRVMVILFVCSSGSYVFADTEMKNSLLSYPVRISFGRAWGTSVKGQYLAPGENKVYRHAYSLDRVSAEYSTDPNAFFKNTKGEYQFDPKVEWKLIATLKKGSPWWTAKQTIIVYPILNTETGAVTPQLSVSGGT